MQILVAEDNVVAARQLADLLPTWGYEPAVVHDGLAALHHLRTPQAPQLALLDWMMPGLEGVEVCAALRQEFDRPYTYVVLLTGYGGRDTMLVGLEAGADDFLLKPIDVHELRARLNSGRRIVQLQQELFDAHRKLQIQATHDALTGLWNRAAILEILSRELTRAQRENRPMSVIMADLDHFKNINDAHGHLGGDEVLRETARRMTTAMRTYDAIGRYGGEEFLLVLPGCDIKTSMRLAERLRDSVAVRPVDIDHTRVHVTMSLGVASSEGTMASASTLLGVADTALYRSKAAGRNQASLGIISTTIVGK